MNEHIAHPGNYGFLAGLLTGTVVGAGVALWLTPTATAEARSRITASARRLGNDLRSTTDGMRDQVEGIRDEVAGAVARGAREVEQFAVTAKSNHRSL
jgi:gas vesicle protein